MSVVGLPFVAARAVVIVSCLADPCYAWIAVQALSDLAILPADMETENNDRGSGLRLEADSDVKVLRFLAREWRNFADYPNEWKDSSLSAVVWEKLSRFQKCFTEFREHLKGSVSRERLLGKELSAILLRYVDRDWLFHAWNGVQSVDANDVAAVVRVALRVVLPLRNVAFAFVPDSKLLLLGTGAHLPISFVRFCSS